MALRRYGQPHGAVWGVEVVVSCFATKQLPASELQRLFGDRGCRHLQTVREVRRACLPSLSASHPPSPWFCLFAQGSGSP